MCCLKYWEFNLVTNFDKYFCHVCHCIQHLYSNPVLEGFICRVDLPFASSWGKWDCEGEYLMSASCFLPSPVHCIYFNFVHTCFFYFCLLRCVVLYQYLQADLHGKSSDTADKTSGKRGLRIKQWSGPIYFFIFSLLTLLESNWKSPIQINTKPLGLLNSFT